MADIRESPFVIGRRPPTESPFWVNAYRDGDCDGVRYGKSCLSRKEADKASQLAARRYGEGAVYRIRVSIRPQQAAR